jgi:hypothetical protein
MKSGLNRHIRSKVLYIDFQLHLGNHLRDTWESPFMALCKVEFIMYKYGWRSEFFDNF